MADAQLATLSETSTSPTTDILEKMSDSERQTWKMTGELPSPKPETPESAPAPSEPEVQDEPKAEPSPAPEAAPVQEKPAEKMSGAEKRIKQLLGRIKELEAAKPAPVAEKVEQVAAATAAAKEPKPTVNDTKADGSPKYATYEDFLDARDAWNEARVQERIESALKAEREATTKAQRDAEIAKQNEAIQTQWKKRVAEATKRHPDFNEVALSKEFMDRLPSGSIPDAFVLESEHGTDVLYHLASQDGELERILALPPIAQARELVKIELGFSPNSTPVPKSTTSAPPPPTELSAKAVPPLDEAQSALQRGDFRAYYAAQNAKELKARKG